MPLSRNFLTLVSFVLFIGIFSSCAHGRGMRDTATDTGKLESTLTGTVMKRIEARGTLSQYTIYVLNTDQGTSVILFNMKRASVGFENWVSKRVIVTGQPIQGRIGNVGKKSWGFRVDSIVLVD